MKACRPPFHESAKEFIFGLDLSNWNPKDAEEFLSTPSAELEGAFLPAGFRTPSHPFSENEKENFIRFDGAEMLPPELTRNAVLTDEKRFRQFLQTVENCVREGAAAGYNSLLLEGAWNKLFSSRDYPAQWEFFLKRVIPVLEETGLHLLLPVAVPAGESGTADRIKRFLNRTMAPRIKVSLKIRFPAPGKPFPKPEESKLLLPETETLHFLVDTDDGMDPDPAPLGEWIGALALYGFKGPCYFTFVRSSAPDPAVLPAHASKWVRRLRGVPENGK